MQPIEHKAMKTSIWKRFFRCDLNFHGGGHAARYNGHEAKRDAKTTRTRLNRMLDKLFQDK